MKIASVVGARPQFIKAAMVSPEIRRTHQEVLIHTGQHYDLEMSQAFFEELNLPAPDYNLGVGSNSQGKQTAQMLERIEGVLLKEEPNLVIVYGDTNSTLAGALAAAKLNISLAHVEAGLRSFNRSMPEEINRVVTDHLSNLLFCPTETAVKNLASEGILGGVHLTGDVMYDAILRYSQHAERESQILSSLNLEPKSYLLATIHRAENTDNPSNLKQILGALGEIDETIVFPVHPRTRKAIERLAHDGGGTQHHALKLIPPVRYLDMLKLERNATIILTDSGGVQKEAYSFKVPCLTLRSETEWVETVEGGWNRVVGVRTEKIVEAVGRIAKGNKHNSGSLRRGNASRRIGTIVADYLATSGHNR